MASKSGTGTAFSVNMDTAPDGALVLHAAGDFDLATVQEFERLLYGRFAEHDHILVDLRGVTYLGARALRPLEEAQARARRSGTRLRLLAPEDHVVARVVRLLRSPLTLLPLTPDEVIDPQLIPTDRIAGLPGFRAGAEGRGIAVLTADAEDSKPCAPVRDIRVARMKAAARGSARRPSRTRWGAR